MNIDTDNTYTIYRNEFENRIAYSTRINKKLKDGSYESAFIPVQFKKDEDIKDRTKLIIKEGWITFFKTKEGKTIFYIFINKYNVVESEETEDYENIKTETNALDSIGVEITDADLPF